MKELVTRNTSEENDKEGTVFQSSVAVEAGLPYPGKGKWNSF